MRAARHLAATAAALLVLAATAAGLHLIGSTSEGPGTLWVLTRGQETDFRAVQGAPGVRVLNHWGRGRLVQLQVDSLSAVRWPAGAVQLAVPLPEALFALAACG